MLIRDVDSKEEKKNNKSIWIIVSPTILLTNLTG